MRGSLLEECIMRILALLAIVGLVAAPAMAGFSNAALGDYANYTIISGKAVQGVSLGDILWRRKSRWCSLR